MLAQRVDPETNHIDGRLTKGEGNITIQLKYPACCDATKDIEKKPWRSDVQVQDVIRSLQIAADDNRAGVKRSKWNASSGSLLRSTRDQNHLASAN